MNRKRISGFGALALAGFVVVLAVTPLGGAAVRHVSMLIAPTSKSAVGDVNAYNNWATGGSMFSRDGFKNVTSPFVGTFCLSGRTNPDQSMLKLTADQQHSNVVAGALAWDRSGPECPSGWYEVLTYDSTGALSDDVAFFAEALKRA
jgi:hypothetical protein